MGGVCNCLPWVVCVTVCHGWCVWVCGLLCTESVVCWCLLQVLDINFDYDSVKKLYTSLPPSPDDISPLSPVGEGEETPIQIAVSPSSSGWVYNEQINDSSSGYQLTQLCHCFSTRSTSPALSPGVKSLGARAPETASTSEPTQENRQRVPSTVTVIQYSTALSMWVCDFLPRLWWMWHYQVI